MYLWDGSADWPIHGDLYDKGVYPIPACRQETNKNEKTTQRQRKNIIFFHRPVQWSFFLLLSHVKDVKVVVDLDAGTRLVVTLNDRRRTAVGALNGDGLLLRAVHLQAQEQQQRQQTQGWLERTPN